MSKQNTIQQKLFKLFAATVDYLLKTVSSAKPGTLRPSLLAVVRLFVRDAGIPQTVHSQADARRALDALRGDLGDAEKALAVPFPGSSTKQ